MLRTELELALRRARRREELEQSVRSAAEETDRLSRIADDLLILARAEQGKLLLRAEPTDLFDVLETVRTRFGARAELEGRPLRVDVDRLAGGAGRPSSARAGAREPRRQRVATRRGRDHDHGGHTGLVGGIARARRGTQAFPTGSRTRRSSRSAGPHRSGDGSGLGLAIVATIVRAHDGTGRGCGAARRRRRRVDQVAAVGSAAWRRRSSAWFDEHGRDLPWRRTRDPYAILVSEVMLQQTQVARVVPRYLAFLDRWPTVDALAAATPAEVIREWQGLGYNRRALNLHRAACRIAAEGWPDDLTELPGVGRYTADAVARFALDRPVLPVDTNVRRVLERTGAEFGPESAHALMDLGATICLARIPRCHTCPLAGRCPSRGRRYEPLRKQSRFEGSFRQRRARTLTLVAERPRRAERARPGGDGVAGRGRARPGSARSRELARRLVGASAIQKALSSV